MPKIKFIVSLLIFSILLGITSTIKNQTRIIEKNIYKIDRRILTIEKDLHETELDYSYLSSPNNLSVKIKDLDFIEYAPMDFSRIYLNYRNFVDSEKKISTTIHIALTNEKFTDYFLHLQKYLFDIRYGSGQSVIEGIVSATNILIAGLIILSSSLNLFIVSQ